jgi:hypothetical protein
MATSLTRSLTPMQHQYRDEPTGMIFIWRYMDNFLHLTSFISGDGCYDRHNSVRFVIFGD